MLVFHGLCAQAAELQDPASFSNGAATMSDSEVRGNMLSWTYRGGEELYEVFKEYIDLLEERKDLKLSGRLKPKDSPIIEMCWYEYFGKESIGSNHLSIDSIDWSGNFHVYVRCTKNNGTHFITLYASQGFKLTDSGARANMEMKKPVPAKPTVKPAPKPTAKPTTKPTAKPETTVSCSKCGGDGQMEKRCSSCNGSGDTRCGSCSGDGDKDCISCSGKGYDRCSGCGGDGENRCSSCYGSGKKGDGKRCFSCSGSGEKSCSSCSGSGKRTCSACRGSGDRKCTSCGGDGKKDCSICSGYGKKKGLCTTCSGSGKVKR